MTDQERTCQSCQAEFTIAPEDFAFYDKMQVPPPTWCPTCRLQRRLIYMTEWRVFQKPDALTGKPVFSNFSPTSPVKVYANDYWYTDAWNPLDYSREYDFSRPFFEQFQELLLSVPLRARDVQSLENSDYCVMAGYLKNCYLVAFADYTQDSAYMVFDAYSKNCFDTLQTESCELCYGSVNLTNCYQTHFSVNCENSREVLFSKDLIGCSNCIGCVGLRNKQYYIFNEPNTKEEYETKLATLHLGSRQSLEALTKQAHDFWLQFPNKFMLGSSNENVSGEYIYHGKNAQHCYRARHLEDSKYAQNISVKTCKESYDHTGWGANAELIYEAQSSGDQAYNIKFSQYCWGNVRNITYSAHCQSASDLFGCVGVRNKRFCIFNKQYTEIEYNELVPRIIEQMHEMPYVDALGREYRYGEFFPAELSPYEYNVSPIKEHFPLTKEQALERGYQWYDQPPRETVPVLTADQLPDDITEVTPDMAGKVIACGHKGSCDHECTVAFAIIPQELAFLIEQGLPLPQICFGCRHGERTTHRRPMTLQTRQCDCQGTQSVARAHKYTNTNTEHGSHTAGHPCPNTFQTSYRPDQPDIVYCDDCYSKEVL